MSLKNWFIKTRDNYVINQVHNIKIPKLETKCMQRYRVVFSGRVQKVGFRLEVCELAKRLELTGFCKNLENGDVMAELQGSHNKIKYLISFMKSLKRIKIKKLWIEKLDVDLNETKFSKL